jgi:hypothetical protein
MMKNLYKFYNEKDTPWVELIWKAFYQNGKLPSVDHQKGSFWWKDCVKLQNNLKEIFHCKAGTGKMCYSGLISGMTKENFAHAIHIYSILKRTREFLSIRYLRIWVWIYLNCSISHRP